MRYAIMCDSGNPSDVESFNVEDTVATLADFEKAYDSSKDQLLGFANIVLDPMAQHIWDALRGLDVLNESKYHVINLLESLIAQAFEQGRVQGIKEVSEQKAS